jgi:hypothetical protein
LNSTILELAQGYAGVLGFTLFFLPPGFLLAYALDLNAFRTRSAAEKLLWSLVLSVPIAIQICTTLGRYLPRPAILSILLVLATAALALLMALPRVGPERPRSRGTPIVLALVTLLALYLVFASTDIQIGHRLYVSTILYDWSVRVPMVEAALRSGVPPLNGLSAIDGHPASLRYFYFWYVVCADLARLLHIPARAALAASSVWAAWSLLAVFFLTLKYLLGLREDLRRLCALSFLVLGILGLDLIPTIPLFLVHKLHPYAELEWWHQDRTPSFLSAAFYAPHHAAAFACLLTGILVLDLTLRETRRSLTLFAGLFAGLCFASASGTSLLPTLVVAIVCAVWALDLLRQRRFHTIAALALSAVTALLLAHTFLHELGSTDGAASSGSLLNLRWRNQDFVLLYMAKYHLLTHHALLNGILAQPAVLLIHLFDLGFFAFVLVHRIRRDRNRSLTPGERTVWAIFLGAAIPYLFLSSASIASPNDLGVDAGFLLRLTLQLWAVPYLHALWRDRGSQRLTPALALASACLALGLAGQLFQVAWQRLYFPLVGSQTLPKQLDLLTTDHLSERLFNIRDAFRTLDATTTAGSIQYNPISPMQPALTFYAHRQIAAFDRGCGTGYGGDYKACQAIMPQLIALYGNTLEGFDHGKAANDRQDNAEPAIATQTDALNACRTLHLVALVAESTDSIWSKRTSWVWTMRPEVANSTVRIFPCPATGNGREPAHDVEEPHPSVTK